MIIVALASMKGGVGKTTLCTHLAATFAAGGVRVLVVDMDTQGHAAAYLGAARSDAAYRLLVEGDPQGAYAAYTPVSALIHRDVRPGLDLIAGNPRTAFAEAALSERMGRERVLARRLAEVEGEYDVALIDVPPGFSVVSSVALYAAGGVLVPVIPGAGPESGVRDLLSRLDAMRREVDRAPAVVGLVANMVMPRELESGKLLDFVSAFPHGPSIRRATRMTSATRAGQTITEYDPASPVAGDYAELARWTAGQMENA